MDHFCYLCIVMLSCLLIVGWEAATLLALLCVMLYCGFDIFPCGVVLGCIDT